MRLSRSLIGLGDFPAGFLVGLYGGRAALVLSQVRVSEWAMKKVVQSVLAVAALVAAVAVPATAPAQAEAPGACALLGTTTVAVGLRPTIATFDVPAVRCAGKRQYQQDWQIRIPRWGVDVTNDFPAAAFDPNYLPNADTAPISVDVRFYAPDTHNPQGQFVLPSAFHLVRQTTFGSSVKVTRVDKTHVRVSGTLKRANWEKGVYQPYSGVRVVVESTPPVKQVARPKVDAKGRFSVTIKQPSSKSWQVVFPGDNTSSPAVSTPRRVN